MRTKALILSAVFCAMGAVSVLAQNVYSVNVVGYTTVTITNAYALIANQLTDNAGDLATNHIPTAATGTIIYKYNPSTGIYASITRIPTGWQGATTMTLAPGEGVFVKKPTAAPSLTLTFVGEVMQTSTHGDAGMNNAVLAGYDIYSAIVPQAGGITTVHQYPVPPTSGSDQVFKYNPALGTYLPYSYSSTGTRWLPTEPQLAVNEAFWIRAANAKDWIRTFDVN